MKMVIATLDPIVKSQIDIKLFSNVTNTPELRKKVMSGTLQCCLVNPKLILDPFQVIIAANKALTVENRTTKTVFTEILFNLSISKNITQSLQRFGVTDESKDVLVITVDDNESKTVSEIEGDEVDLKELEEIQDLNAIKKIYKIGPNEEKNTTLLDSVVSRIATKDCVAH